MADHISPAEPRRFVTIATASFLPQVERLVRSLRAVHPGDEIVVFVDDASAFSGLTPFARIVPLPAIADIGVKRAKFTMYRMAMDGGPFVYLDGDIVVLRRLDALFASAGLTASADDLSGCPFIVDRTHPWPGDPTLANRRYVNSGVLGFGAHLARWVSSMEALALDDEFWMAHIHPDGLFDNHVLCAMLELHDIPLTLVSATEYNWQGYRSPAGDLVAAALGGTLVHRGDGVPLRLVHFAGVRNVEEHLMSVPLAVAEIIDAASVAPLSPERALAAVRAWHAPHGTRAHEDDVAIEVVSRALVDTMSPTSATPTFVSEPAATVSVALSLRPSTVRWNGLQCGGAYLEATEYVALRQICRATRAATVVETGAGETSRLFAALVPRCISLEPTSGPWVERALEAGADVRLVPFEPGAGFEPAALRSALAEAGDIDLLFVDSPVGTAARVAVLDQILERSAPAHILMHDARRDAVALLGAIPQGKYRVSMTVPTHRAFVLLSRLDAADVELGARPESWILHEFGADIVADMTGARRSDDRLAVPVSVTNRSSEDWPDQGDQPVAVAYHVRDGDRIVQYEGVRTALPCRVDAGDVVSFEVTISLSDLPAGSYEIDLCLVQESVAWFESVDPGSITTLPTVTV